MPIAIDGHSRKFSFKCSCCGKVHEGGPSFSFSEPSHAHQIPEEQWNDRVRLNSDLCILDEEDYFVRATLEIPIKDTEDSFLWGVWVTQSKDNFDKYVETFEEDQSGLGAFGWLTVTLPGYTSQGEEWINLPVDVIWGTARPEIEIHDDQDHPLAVDQREGISWERAVEISLLINQCNSSQV